MVFCQYLVANTLGYLKINAPTRCDTRTTGRRHAMLLPQHYASAGSPKPPQQKDEYDKPQPSRRAILLQQQLPIDSHRGPFILRRVLFQPRTQISHLLQTISSIQEVVDILRHDRGDILELIVQARQVITGAAVLVRLLRLLDETVELGVGVGSQLGVEVVVAFVGGFEFAADVFEVGEGELFGVGALGYGYVGY